MYNSLCSASDRRTKVNRVILINMKKILALTLLAGIAIGCGLRRVSLPPVHAQASGQTFTCQASPTGVSVQCSQYLVQVDSQRGFPKFQIWQVQGQPALIDGSNGSTFANYGSGSSVSMQAFQLATGTSTLTLALNTP